MNRNGNDVPGDQWSDWLLQRRHGGDPTVERHVRRMASGIADRVLDGAHLEAGCSLLDLGTGDGLVAFLALARTPGAGTAVLTDVSAPLLQHARATAESQSLLDRCTFLSADAETLDGVTDMSVDVVTARAVLAYVPDKAAAFRACLRVLRPGGRLSIAEPIFRDEAIRLATLAAHLEILPASAETEPYRLMCKWKGAQLPIAEADIAASPLTSFSERELLSLAQAAGFVGLHLELHIDVHTTPPVPWAVFLNTAPHPGAPTLAEVLAERFTPEEAAALERAIRPLVESESQTEREAIAYLTAVKPS